MRLFKIQNFVPKLKFFRITKKRIGIQNPGYRGYPLIPCLKSLPPPPNFDQTWTNFDQSWRVWSSPTWLHISSCRSCPQVRHAQFCTLPPRRDNILLPQPNTSPHRQPVPRPGTLICWRGSDENCWREQWAREEKLRLGLGGPAGGRDGLILLADKENYGRCSIASHIILKAQT